MILRTKDKNGRSIISNTEKYVHLKKTWKTKKVLEKKSTWKYLKKDYRLPKVVI